MVIFGFPKVHVTMTPVQIYGIDIMKFPVAKNYVNMSPFLLFLLDNIAHNFTTTDFYWEFYHYVIICLLKLLNYLPDFYQRGISNI